MTDEQAVVSSVDRADRFTNGLGSWLLRPVSSHGLNTLPNEAVTIRSSTGFAREENQDVAVVVAGVDTAGPLITCVLCDGMSSFSDGRRAAVAAATAFTASVFDRYVRLPLRERLTEALGEANEAVLRFGRAGSTLVAILISDQEAWGASVGDSRLYWVSQSAEVTQINKDDTVAYALSRLQEQGHSALDLRRFARRLTNYLGMQEKVQAQYYELSVAGDQNVYLLTSDGAHELGNSELIATAMNSARLPETGAQSKTEENRLGTGIDDASIIIIRSQITEHLRSMMIKTQDVSVWDAWGFLQIQVSADNWAWARKRPAAGSPVAGRQKS